MARIARVVIPGYPYHITQRGNYKQRVFSCTEDYRQYLMWVSDYSEKNKISILAYCLMPNHVHFIGIPENHNSLSRTFNLTHMRYSQYYNKKDNRKGHLWQGRFFSTLLGENHLYEAIRYVENNPVKANICEKAEDWEWSSARDHLNKRGSKIFLEIEDSIDGLGVKDWSLYLNEDIDKSIEEEIKRNTLTGRPCGTEGFVEKLEKVLGRRLRALPEGRPRKIR